MADLSLDLNPLHVAFPTYRDLLVVNNDLCLTSDANPAGTNPILQDILTRLRFGLGEWFLDNSQGIPYLQQVLVKNPDISKITAIFQNTIMGTPGVIQLTSFSMTVNTAKRFATVQFACVTTSGPVSYNGSVSPVTGGLT